MEPVLLYHDFASPFCRLALAAAVAAAEGAGRPIELVPFELRPTPVPLPAPTDAAVMEELEAGRPLADALGVALARPPLVPRTRKAHEAVAFAREEGRAVALAQAIYDALWRDGRDIGRLDVLAELGAGVGLDEQKLHIALGLDDYEPGVVALEEAAEQAGLDGVPTFRIGEAVAVGVFPPAELAEWMAENG